MTDQEIVNFWGIDNLKRWSESRLRNVNIPESSKRFLVQVGLPRKERWHFRFDPEMDDLPALPNKKNLRRIGLFGYDSSICLDENQGGGVVWVSADGVRESVINSDVEHFARFLVLYGDYVRNSRTVSPKEYMEYVEKVVARIERKMRKIDPRALEDVESFWSVIIEQMQDGLI